MKEMISTPPKTIMELFKMLPEGTPGEVIEGSIYMSPAPNDRHNGIVVQVVSRIFLWIDHGILAEFTLLLIVFFLTKLLTLFNLTSFLSGMRISR